MTYKIEVIMTPLTHDSPKKPYFWIIYSNTGKEGSSWCNHTAGWAKTPEKAWAEANEFYNKYCLGGQL